MVLLLALPPDVRREFPTRAFNLPAQSRRQPERAPQNRQHLHGLRELHQIVLM